MVEEVVPKNQEKEEESKKDEYKGDYRNGDKLDDAVEFFHGITRQRAIIIPEHRTFNGICRC